MIKRIQQLPLLVLRKKRQKVAVAPPPEERGGGGDNALALSSSRRSSSGLSVFCHLWRVASLESRIAKVRGRVAVMLTPPPPIQRGGGIEARGIERGQVSRKTMMMTLSPPGDLGGGGRAAEDDSDGDVGGCGRCGGNLSAVDESSESTRLSSCNRSSSSIKGNNSRISMGLVAETQTRIRTMTRTLLSIA